MRLKNRKPADIVGRTILYKSQAWLVKQVDANTIYLNRPGLKQFGQLRHDQLATCRLYPTREEILSQFPMLVRALRCACFLSEGDAVGAIHGMITTGPYFMGSESVAHVGGSANAIGIAWRWRNIVRRQASMIAAL